MLLFSSVASALGLGEIEMQSALNQRLDAEIPLRGVPEDDRSLIIVSLASEEAFRQVGLRRPFSLTRLSFEVKQRDSGEYYIHVTSREPVVEPFLSFLIEVDWPDGNLLREYTVLLDPPVFVSDTRGTEPAAAEPEPAPDVDEQPEDTMAGADVPAEIERDVDSEPAPEPAPEPEPDTTAEAEAPAATAEDAAAVETRRAEGDFSETPVFLQVEQAEERAEAEARAVAEAEAEAASEAEPEVSTSGYETGGGDYGPVQRGEALWNIASRLKSDDMTVQQMMLALLRYNPEAFVDGNINRLKQGYVLRIPDAEAVLSLSAQQAVARVREQNALWQEYRRAVAGGTGRAERQQAAGVEAAPEAVAGDDADLRIVGSEEGTGAGSEQEASATSGGTQVSEDLELARERLESARMEKAELESRVEELEDTVGKMERLIELREDQLAKLQDQLRRIEEGADPAEVLAADEEGTAEAAVEAETEAEEEATRVTEADTDAAETADGATADTEGDETAGISPDADTSADAETEAAGDTATADAAAVEDGDEMAEQPDAGQAETTAVDDGGVVTVRTQPPEPGILDQVSGIFRSIGQAVGGLVAGLGLGGLIPEPFVLPAAGGVVALLLLAAMLAVRRRRHGLEDEGGEEAVVDAEAASIFATAEDETEEDFSGLFEERDDTVAADDSGLVDSLETEASELVGEDETVTDAESELMSESFDLEGLEDSDEPVSVDAESAEDDTIAEADVYLAYGLHQQAEDLLNLALEEQPDRVDYRAKLLEAIYGDGRSGEFVEQARALRERIEDTDSDPHWLRVVAMGKELAPSEEMFQQEVDDSLKPSAGTGQPPETDLDLGGDEEATDLDFSFEEEGEAEADHEIDETDDDEFARTMMVESDSLTGEEAETGAETTDSGEEMDFDLGDLDLGEESDDEEAAGEADEGTDFDLDHLDLAGEEDEAAPAEAAEADIDAAEGADFDLSDFDLDEDEDSSLAGEETGEPDEDALADRDVDESGELTETAGTGEIDLGDLELESIEGETGEREDEEVAESTESAAGEPDFDFDLSEDEAAGAGEIDLGDLELEDNEATVAGGDTEAGEDLATTDSESEADSEITPAPEEPADAEDETGPADLDSAVPETDDQAAGDETETSSTDVSPEDSDAEVSLDELTADLAEDDSGLTGPDDEASVATESAAGAGTEPSAEEQAAEDDEDEYRTMLDLARAYIDMGDAESARSALEEVAESGSAAQRSEAQSLLDSI